MSSSHPTASSSKQLQPVEIAPITRKHPPMFQTLRSDGQIKEQIELQELARSRWESTWGFMKKENVEKIYEEEAIKLGLDPDFMNKHRIKSKKHSTIDYPVPPSPDVPFLSSGLVGWRSSRPECTLEIVGPLYVSPRCTIDPPRHPDDLPEHQTYIYLG